MTGLTFNNRTLANLTFRMRWLHFQPMEISNLYFGPISSQRMKMRTSMNQSWTLESFSVRWKFHQHLLGSFFVWKCYAQFFSTYSYVCIFLAKIKWEKSAFKLFMKLTIHVTLFPSLEVSCSEMKKIVDPGFPRYSSNKVSCRCKIIIQIHSEANIHYCIGILNRLTVLIDLFYVLNLLFSMFNIRTTMSWRVSTMQTISLLTIGSRLMHDPLTMSYSHFPFYDAFTKQTHV